MHKKVSPRRIFRLTNFKKYAMMGLIRKKPKGETDYSLKDGIAELVRINLDYVLKRMSDKQIFDNLQEIAQYLRMLLSFISLWVAR